MQYFKGFRLFLSVFLTMAINTATASIITFSNPSGFSGNESFIGFESTGVSSSEELHLTGGVGFSLLEVDTLIDTGFAPTMAGAPQSTFAREFPPFGSDFLNTTNFDAPFFVDMKIEFQSLINIFAVELRHGQSSNDIQSISFEFYLDDLLIGAQSLPSRGTDDFFFYGFLSSTEFNNIVIRDRDDARFDLDNLRFENTISTNVDAPSITFIMLLGILGPYALRRKSHQRGQVLHFATTRLTVE